MLYRLVTKRGGFVKVVDDKLWPEVIQELDWSPNTPGAALALKY